ncbi:MAG TPA: DctP family TRAP transporter solute-binding subunit [Deinococcales bacterium]|nr:DctP family TRAP transporter solute-binding subunit [Deinococcales bacterium]
MKKRYVALACLTSALAIAGVASSQGSTVTLKFTAAAVADDWHGKAMTVFKQYVEKNDPTVKVELYPASQLFRQDAELAALQRGNAELAYLSAQQLAPFVPDLEPLTAGYVIQKPLHLCTVWNNAFGQDLRKQISDKADVTVLDILYLGTRQLGLRIDKTIRTPADMAGVKLRMPNSAAWLFLGQALGANPTPLAFSEVYLALQTGTIDGQDNPLPSVKSAKFYEVTKQIVLTSHLVDGITLAISNKMWTRLNAKQQSVVKAGARAAADFNNKGRFQDEKELVAFFKAQGIKVSTPNVAAFRDTVLKAYEGSEFAKSWKPGVLNTIKGFATTANTPKECFSYFY